MNEPVLSSRSLGMSGFDCGHFLLVDHSVVVRGRILLDEDGLSSARSYVSNSCRFVCVPAYSS